MIRLLSSPVPSAERGRVLLVDGFLVVALLVFVGGALTTVSGDDSRYVTGAVLAAVAAVSLVVRRVYPLVSGSIVAITGAATLVLVVVLAEPVMTGGLAPATVMFGVVSLVSLYTLTAHAGFVVSSTALGVVLLSAVVLVVIWDGRSFHPLTAVVGAGVMVVFVLGVWSMGRVRRSRLHELQMLAERNRALEAEREGAAERAATEERTRIAREMHDIVAHSLSAVIAQADGGRYAARADPDAGVRSLETISTTARSALSDMRALLGVLREEEPRETSVPRDVGDIAALVDDERARGADVVLMQRGVARPLPAGLGLTAFRIAQEALTNVRVHAPHGTRIRIETTWATAALTLTIDDVEPAGPSRPSAATVPSGGRGVLGMRERASLHGGTLEARPTATGFRVTAVLPLPAGSGAPGDGGPPSVEGSVR